MIWLIVMVISLVLLIVSFLRDEPEMAIGFVVLLSLEITIGVCVRYVETPSDMDIEDITARLECDSEYLNVQAFMDAVKYNKRVECAHDLGNSIWFGTLVRKKDKMADPIPLENYKITKNCKD